MDSQRKRSTLQRLSLAWPMNDNHDGPVPPDVGRWCLAHTRYTTFLSMSTPNVCEMMRAIRGQPNRGLRDLSSTMARMSASSGPSVRTCWGTASMRTDGGTCDAPTPDERPGASTGGGRWRPFGCVPD